MIFKYLHEWEIVSYVQIIFFVLLLGSFLVVLFVKPRNETNGKMIRVFSIYFGIFNLFKIVGGICALVLLHQSKAKVGLTIATYIFDTVSLGVLIKSLLPFVEAMTTDREQLAKFDENPFKFEAGSNASVEVPVKKNLPFKLLTVVILVAVILSIVGASLLDSDPGTSRSTLKASSILYLVAILLMGALIVWGFTLNTEFSGSGRLLLVALLFFIVRASYSIISSFAGISFDSPSKYILLYGDWYYYCFLALLPECIIGVFLLVNCLWFLYNVR